MTKLPDEMLLASGPAPNEMRPTPEPEPKGPTEVMLDIETLSTSTHNAVVLSIGAVHFRLTQSGIAVATSGIWVPDLNAQIAAGREISAETMKFWRGQSAEARAHWADVTPSRVPDVLHALRVFIDEIKSKSDQETPIWSNGCCFDIGNLESLYAQNKMPIPWRYNSVRDARTIYKATPQLRERPDSAVKEGNHNPVTDCLNQIWGLWEHRAEAEL